MNDSSAAHYNVDEGRIIGIPILGLTMAFNSESELRVTLPLHYPLMLLHSAKTTGLLAGKSCYLLALVSFILEVEKSTVIDSLDILKRGLTSLAFDTSFLFQGKTLWSQCLRENENFLWKAGSYRRICSSNHIFLMLDSEAAWKEVGVPVENLG